MASDEEVRGLAEAEIEKIRTAEAWAADELKRQPDLQGLAVVGMAWLLLLAIGEVIFGTDGTFPWIVATVCVAGASEVWRSQKKRNRIDYDCRNEIDAAKERLAELGFVALKGPHGWRLEARQRPRAAQAIEAKRGPHVDTATPEERLQRRRERLRRAEDLLARTDLSPAQRLDLERIATNLRILIEESEREVDRVRAAPKKP